MRAPDDKLDEMLSQGRLSGRQYDAIWAKVLERVEAPSSFWAANRGRFLFLGTGLAGAALMWFIFVLPKGDHFGARGAGSNGSDAFGLACASTGRAVCHAGETLMFSVNTAVANGVFGAYAERLDEGQGERLWYFPQASGAAPTVPPGDATMVLSDGIVIGPEQPPGRYRVTVWTSPNRVSRIDADLPPAGGAIRRSTIELEVLP